MTATPKGKIKLPGLYVVCWLDILSDPTWVGTEPEKTQPATCVTAGWLVFADEKKLVLADSRSADGDWGGLTVIPLGVVVDRYRVSGKGPESFMISKPKQKTKQGN